MQKLTVGQEVTFSPTKLTGKIVETQHKGMIGVLKAGKQTFTVMAEECTVSGQSPDKLEELFIETRAQSGAGWIRPAAYRN